jgi:hypothetical protein
MAGYGSGQRSSGSATLSIKRYKSKQFLLVVSSSSCWATDLIFSNETFSVTLSANTRQLIGNIAK